MARGSKRKINKRSKRQSKRRKNRQKGGDVTGQVTTTGEAKKFRFGDKSISITGPMTISIGVPTDYKVEPVKGYDDWDTNQFLNVILKITDPTGNVNQVNYAKTYTFDPKFAGNYTLLAYASDMGECYNENDCPNVTMTVKVVASDSSASDLAAAQQKMNTFMKSIPGLMTWFDATDPNNGSAPPANGANMANWSDKSGNGYNASSTVPIGGKYNTSICNGLPGVSFGSPVTNGLSVIAGGFTTDPIAKSAYVTVFFVFTPCANQNVVAAAIASPWAQATSSGDHYITRLLWPNSSSMCLDGNTSVGTAKVSQLNGPGVLTLAAMTPPQPMLVTLVTNASGINLTCYGNGITNLATANLSATWASTPNPTGSAPVILGTDVAGQGSTFLYGALSEVIHYNATLSLENIQYVQGYLADKWGLSPYLPSSHPYYNTTLTSVANSASAAGYKAASAAGYQGASTASYQGASAAAYKAASAAGYQGASTASYQGASTASYQGASAAAYKAASAAGYQGASTASYQGASAAAYKAASAAGYQGASAAAYQSASAASYPLPVLTPAAVPIVAIIPRAPPVAIAPPVVIPPVTAPTLPTLVFSPSLYASQASAATASAAIYQSASAAQASSAQFVTASGNTAVQQAAQQAAQQASAAQASSAQFVTASGNTAVQQAAQQAVQQASAAAAINQQASAAAIGAQQAVQTASSALVAAQQAAFANPGIASSGALAAAQQAAQQAAIQQASAAINQQQAAQQASAANAQ